MQQSANDELDLAERLHRHVERLADDINLAIVVVTVGGGHLQLVGRRVVDAEFIVLDHIDCVSSTDLLETGYIAVGGRNHDATGVWIEDGQTAANLATGDIDVGAALGTNVDLPVLA
jgi:hypothetical protein